MEKDLGAEVKLRRVNKKLRMVQKERDEVSAELSKNEREKDQYDRKCRDLEARNKEIKVKAIKYKLGNYEEN